MLQLFTRLAECGLRLLARSLLDELLPRNKELVEMADASGRPVEPSLKQVAASVVTEQFVVVGLDLTLDRQTPCLTEGLLRQSDDGQSFHLGARGRLGQRLQACLGGRQKFRNLLASRRSPITFPFPMWRFGIGIGSGIGVE